ncbi:MAG TPA: lamin tail domain-containing protein [Chloroflexia bacterium]|nr:lamin tail domain-containing protein [Chloroflexia bacterium]
MKRHMAVAILLLILAGGLTLVNACSTTSTTDSTPAPTSGGGFVPSNGGNPGTGGNTGTGGTTSRGAVSAGNNVMSNPSGGLPNQANKPPVPTNNYQGCPSTGDGGDPALNIRKDRTDSASWYPVAINSILGLPWPQGVARHARATWGAADAAAVAQYEGIPVQVEGWLAGAKQEGPESCNCHSPDDVDNHLWIVDSPSKDRSQAVVVEITPRVRAQHPGWAFERIRPLVDGQTKIRISGWLLMDQEHPEQIGKTRGTLWEIHPIIAFDVQRGNQWVSLDTGRVATTQTNPGGSGADAVPTEDPNLPPAIVETVGPGFGPTATARPAGPSSGGHTTSSGAVAISDISYHGAIKPNEPDEYVEITNNGDSPVNMDGWVLRDVYGGQEFTWQGFTLQPGQKIRIYTNETHADSGGFSFQSGQAIWNNKGDAAELLDGSGTVVSSFAYGNKR